MTGPVGSSTYSALDRMLASAGSLSSQYSVLQQQTSTGKVAQSYAGLGAVSAQVLDLTAATSRSDAYTQSIVQAQGKASVMQNALTQIGSVVSTMAASALGLTGSSAASSVDSVAQQAKLAMSQIASLLNSSYAGDYVFAGADTANAPVPAPDAVTSSGMYTAIGAQVAALATTPTSPAVGQVIANTVAIAGSDAAGTTVFSSYLSGAGATAAPVNVQVSESQSITLDLPANRNAGATSDPAINGTGSAVKDVLRSLAVLANSTSAMAGNPDFAKLMKDASATLTSAGKTLAQESGSLGLTQNAMTAAASSHASLKTVLTKQLTGLTDVDMASAISRLQTVGSQLQASYKVISLAQSLNLASFL